MSIPLSLTHSHVNMFCLNVTLREITWFNLTIFLTSWWSDAKVTYFELQGFVVVVVFICNMELTFFL